jgi:hypothetical protein
MIELVWKTCFSSATNLLDRAALLTFGDGSFKPDSAEAATPNLTFSPPLIGPSLWPYSSGFISNVIEVQGTVAL